MPNMGYCRFQNTLRDLQDCRDYMDDKSLSEAEQEARKRLIELCMEICDGYSGETCK